MWVEVVKQGVPKKERSRPQEPVEKNLHFVFVEKGEHGRKTLVVDNIQPVLGREKSKR